MGEGDFEFQFGFDGHFLIRPSSAIEENFDEVSSYIGFDAAEKIKEDLIYSDQWNFVIRTRGNLPGIKVVEGGHVVNGAQIIPFSEAESLSFEVREFRIQARVVE